jgi:hypothetical protein
MVITDEGEELKVEKTTVGGTMSHGMLCDSKMLGWSGGAAVAAVQVPESIAIGEAPPASKPGPRVSFYIEEEAAPGPVTEPLYEKKLTKEEKKKLAVDKRAAKKAAKENKTAQE